MYYFIFLFAMSTSSFPVFLLGGQRGQGRWPIFMIIKCINILAVLASSLLM